MRQTYTVVKYDVLTGDMLDTVCRLPLGEAVRFIDEGNAIRHLLRLHPWYQAQYKQHRNANDQQIRLTCSRGFAIKELLFD
jgi:hypothetical protein